MWAGGGCVCGVRGTAALMCLFAFRFSLSSLAHALHASSSWCVALRGPVSKGSFFFLFQIFGTLSSSFRCLCRINCQTTSPLTTTLTLRELRPVHCRRAVSPTPCVRRVHGRAAPLPTPWSVTRSFPRTVHRQAPRFLAPAAYLAILSSSPPSFLFRCLVRSTPTHPRAMAFVAPGAFVRGTRTSGVARNGSCLFPSGFTTPGLRTRGVSVRAPASLSRLSMAATSARDLAAPARSGLLAINDEGGVHVQQRARPRRNRKSEGLRSMVRENVVTPANLIYPLFVHTEAENVPIPSMPGCVRHTIDSAVREVGEARALGVRSVILFPKIPEELKSNAADECYNPSGLVPTLVATLKAKYPDVAVWTDVALDPYSDQGHDGMVSDDKRGDGGCGRILNDETVEQLCRQALCQARAGADVVAPSDMMDGRIGAIRDALDGAGFTDVSIVSYTAKYASAFYGPFRDALDSAPRESSNAPRNKKTYQMDPANSREALIEAALDVAEGADMLMIKPGMPYLDIIRRLREATDLPLAAYHVSGEYAMMKAAVERGWLDEREAVMESLLCFKRAGADAILTYYAKQAAEWMNE